MCRAHCCREAVGRRRLGRLLWEVSVMVDTFDTAEIFKIAEQIERNGARFYRRAAEIFDDGDIRDIFRQLAEWETKHERAFARMRERLSDSGGSPGNLDRGRTVNDPTAMAGLAVFGIRSNPWEELTGHESRTQVLRRAVDKEKDSIVFYEGLKGFAADCADRDRIDDIIREEMRHILILTRWME